MGWPQEQHLLNFQPRSLNISAPYSSSCLAATSNRVLLFGNVNAPLISIVPLLSDRVSVKMIRW